MGKLKSRQYFSRRKFLKVGGLTATAVFTRHLLQLHAGSGFVKFLWAGALTPTSARVNARIDHESSSVRLHVSTNPDLSNPFLSGIYIANTAVNNRVVSIPVTGLTPNTQYYYGIESGGLLDNLMVGQFKTPGNGAYSFTFALGSCAQTGSTHTVFNTIRSLNPLFFLHMGDMHYENINVNDRNLYRGAYNSVLYTAQQGALFRQMPVAYMWDDHDYGPNDSDRTANGREAARLTYQEYVPHYPLVTGSGNVPIYQSFAIGRVFFILTDLRSERSEKGSVDDAHKTMMGAAQKAWFKQQLLMARDTYTAVFWVSTMPWIGAASAGADYWAGYSTERTELAQFIKNAQINNLIVISGDAHMVALDDGSNSNYSGTTGSGFPVFHAGALDQVGSVKGGPYSHGSYPSGGQFGLITVVDDGGNSVTVTLSGRDANNNVLVEHTVNPVFHPLNERTFLPIALND